ncbi:MAG TPA: putative 2OG-Fe(II) oxygenase [Sphingomicrobium sp.]|nr:putative 2OG-Fe(II) oxygenase [Sphingomicrobium sp.]
MADAIGTTLSEDELFDLASETLESGDPEKGLALLSPAMKSGTGNSGLWHLHGLLLRRLDRRQEAIESLRRASVLAPGSPRIAHALARTLFEAGLPSLEAYGRAVRLAPADTEVLAGMTSACAAEGQAGAAIDGLDQLLSRSPQWVEGHSLLARLRWAQGERDRFTRSFETAVAAHPQNLLLWREWLIALMHAEQWDEARRVIGKGRAAVGDNAIFAANDAIIAAETGDCETAEALFQPFVDVDDATVQVRRVRNYLRWGRPADADAIISTWSARPEAFMFWPYASIAWRMLDDPRWAWLEGDERFVGVYDIADRLPPLDVLADKLRGLHSLDGQPLEQSLRGGTQTEGDIFMHVDPVLVQLREAIRATVAEHVAQLPDPDRAHPLLGPPRQPIGFSGAWSVWLKTGGFHANHVHPMGWISSALYVVLPPDLGKGDAGFLTLGDSSSPTLQLEMPPFRTVEPKPARLALFPSYTWHGTRPFGEGERITVAFDVAIPGGR